MLAFLLTSACQPVAEHLPPPSPFPITGTFSNLRVVEESGDLIGAQVTVEREPDGEYRARVMYVEGAPAPEVVSPVTYDQTGECHRISLILGAPYNGSFTGCLGAVALVGAFRFPAGAEERVYLPRQRPNENAR